MVILIIGILALSVLPRVSVLDDIKLSTAGRTLISHIQYVQNSAITRHTDMKIVFDSVNEKYEAFYFDSSDLTWYPLIDPALRTVLIMDFQSDSQLKGVDITSVNFNGASTLQFNWEGIPHDGSAAPLAATGTLTLTYKSNTVDIDVIPDTGKVIIN